MSSPVTNVIPIEPSLRALDPNVSYSTHMNELHLLMLLDQIQNKIVLTLGCPVSSLFWLVCFVSLTLTLPTSAIVQNAGWAARTVKKPEKKFMAARPIVLATPERASHTSHHTWPSFKTAWKCNNYSEKQHSQTIFIGA